MAREGVDDSERRQAIGMLDDVCVPLDETTIAGLLLRLRLLTTTRDLSRQDKQAQYAGYLEELSEWPGDIAEVVLRERARKSGWWPNAFELCLDLQQYGMRRNSLRRAIEGRG